MREIAALITKWTTFLLLLIFFFLIVTQALTKSALKLFQIHQR